MKGGDKPGNKSGKAESKAEKVTSHGLKDFFSFFWPKPKPTQVEPHATTTAPQSSEPKSEAVTFHTQAVERTPEETKAAVAPSYIVIKTVHEIKTMIENKETITKELQDVFPTEEIKQNKESEFWFYNPSREIVLIEEISFSRHEDRKEPEFELLQPCDLILGPQTEKQTEDNIFLVRFNPPREGQRYETTITFKFLFSASKRPQTLSMKVFGQGTFRERPDSIEIAKDLNHISFPLRFIPDKWHMAVDSLLNPDSDDLEMSMGLHACLVVLKEIYYMNSEAWREIRDKVIVGIVKATADCGNTSVSMGLAYTFFQNNKTARVVGFLNCGTGGARFQLYLRHGDTCVCIAESKPGTGAVSRLGGLANSNYHPPGGKAPQSLEEVAAELAHGMKCAPWNDVSPEGVRVQVAKRFNITIDENLPVFAFVTGSIRNYYSQSDHETKQELDAAMEPLLKDYGDPISELLQEGRFQEEAHGFKSYFISQKREGEMEFIGAHTMQKAVDEQRDRTGLRPNEPVACLGIGTGSSQLSIAKPGGKKQLYTILEFDKGMQALQGLLTLGRDFVQNPDIQDLVAAAHAADRKGRIPMILLKSGCLIRLWSKDYEAEREILATPTETKFWLDECAGTTKQCYHALPGSAPLSRLCAEVTKELNSPVDLVTVYRGGRREPDSSSCSQFQPGDACAYEGLPSHMWWWPEKEKTKDKGLPPADPHAKLLIYLPFNLLKEFLPKKKKEKKNPTLEIFKDLLQMHFTRNAHQKPTSFECVCKVYRLLYELRGNTDRELAYEFYDFAANFVDQTPEYDEEQATAFRQLRPYLAASNVVGGIINPRTPLPKLTQDKNQLDSNRRVAVVFLDDFRRALQAVCNSPYVKHYRDLTSEANVKSKDSATRKLLSSIKEGKGGAEAIVDYLRGTIYIGRNTEEAVYAKKGNGPTPQTLTTDVLADQVENILKAIAFLVGPIKRVKLDYIEKGRGFIITNVEFQIGIIKHICEIQIRLKPLECSATPDDHLKHEVGRTFGSCLDLDTRLDRACIDFFTVPCKTAFQRFFETQMVTLKNTPSGIEIEQREEKVEEKTQMRGFTEMWIEQMKRYQKFVRNAWWDEEIMATKVFFPPYAVKKERASFYKGVKFGFQFLQEAMQKRRGFAGPNEYVQRQLVHVHFANKFAADLVTRTIRLQSRPSSIFSPPPLPVDLPLISPEKVPSSKPVVNAPPPIVVPEKPTPVQGKPTLGNVKAAADRINAAGSTTIPTTAAAATTTPAALNLTTPGGAKSPGLLLPEAFAFEAQGDDEKAVSDIAHELHLAEAQMYRSWSSKSFDNDSFVEPTFIKEVAATKTNYVMGIMSAFRYCRRGRLGILMRDRAESITAALEADVPTRQMFGVLEAMHYLADKVQAEWTNAGSQPPIKREPSVMVKEDTQSQIHAFEAHQILVDKKPPAKQ